MLRSIRLDILGVLGVPSLGDPHGFGLILEDHVGMVLVHLSGEGQHLGLVHQFGKVVLIGFKGLFLLLVSVGAGCRG